MAILVADEDLICGLTRLPCSSCSPCCEWRRTIVRNVEREQEREWSIEEIIEALQQWKDMFYSESETKWLMNKAAGLLKEQEIVRCKDCKWYDERISMCDNCGLPREQIFFCADGKWRIDDA